MLKNKRLVSFIAMLAICFSFLVPAFVAPNQAAASSTYTVLSAPTVSRTEGTELGSVEVYIPSMTAFTKDYDYLTITMPSGVTVPEGTPYPTLGWLPVSSATGSQGISLELPAKVDGEVNGITNDALTWKVSSKTSFEIRVEKAKLDPNGVAGKFIIGFKQFSTKDADTGDINVTFMPPTSGVTAFTAGAAVIGKISTETGTVTMPKSVKTISKAPGQEIDSIVVAETAVGSIKNSTQIKLKLPSDYTWTDISDYGIVGSWAFDGTSILQENYSYTGEGTNELTITVKSVTRKPATAAGRIAIGSQILSSDNKTVLAVPLKINVPDSAPNGDVVCSVSGSEGITDQDVVIAKVGDYGITVTEGDKTEVTAGKKEQKLGSFYVEESLAGSLVEGRSIKISLPDGLKWEKSYLPKTEISGGVVLESASLNSTYDAVTYKIKTASKNTASKIKFYDGKVQISPAFSGPVKLTISGTAGVSGEVNVAECKPSVTMTADASKTVIIGLPNQTASDITITEGKKGAIMDSSTLSYKSFKITLPAGVTFYSKPTVTVAEGNLAIDSYKLTDNDGALEIKIKSSSTSPSKIVISDVKLTLDRTVPEGQLKAKLSTYGDPSANTYALDETTLFSTRDSAGSVVIGTCVTPAPANQGRSALFTIGSNIATMNGSYVIMDAAPYIKASRAYVPVRYLADALGATTQWDPATQTATLTLGDKSVVLVIGSKVEKVNGADVTMDVAPEIVNGRTMLPARYVAEGLGYQVGWNAATKQVIIQ